MRPKITERDMLTIIEKILWIPDGKPIYHTSLSDKEQYVVLYLLNLGYIERHESSKKVQYGITSNGINFFVNVKMLRYTKRLTWYTIILIFVGAITLFATIVNLILFLS